MRTTLALRVILAFLLIGSGVMTLEAGIPPFSSTMSGPYGTINLSDLNVHLEIPVISRNGRGSNFVFNIQYDSAVLSQATVGSSKTWTYAPNYGWKNNATAVYGEVHWYSRTASCTYQLQKYNYTYFVFDYMTDSKAVRHGITGAIVSNDSDVACNPYRTKSLVTASTNDGSGYTVKVSTDGSQGYATVYPRSGGFIDPMGYTKADSNGNQITSTGSVFTDTLGTALLSISGTAPGNVTYTYQAPGGPATVVLGYTIKTLQTALGCSGVGVSDTTIQNVPLLTSITYQDRAYQINYEATPGNPNNSTGRIASLTLPTSGQITYTYSGGDMGTGVYCSDGSMATLTIGTPDGETTFARSLSGSTWQTTITDPLQNQTVLNFSGNFETKRTVSQYANGQLSTLLTKVICYNKNFASCDTASVAATPTQLDVYTQLPSGSISLDQSLYTTAGLITEHDEYDYGVTMGVAPTANPVRKTLTTYATLGNYISDLPASVVVQDGSGNPKAQTTYSYDQTAVTATSGTPQHVAVSGSRGNLTTITTTTSTGKTLSKTYKYYDTGNLYQATDVNGAVTTYVYGAGSCGNSFPTQVNYPLSLSTTAMWNCTGGIQTGGTDFNQNATSASYTDSAYWRPATSTDQAGNITQYNYPSVTRSEFYLEFNSNNSIAETLTTVDSLSRVKIAQHQQGPGSSNYDSTETSYDTSGRAYQTTVPYVGTAGQGSTSSPVTTVLYDALGRPTSATDGGGGSLSYTYISNDVLQVTGPAPTGENLKQKQLEYDALGRLAWVCEVTSASGSGACGSSGKNGYWTKYSYDVLGNLVGVRQNAQAAQGSQQSRAFAYDMLGRMTSETNPETGNQALTYVYDSLSNDASCGSPNFPGNLVKKVDTAGNVTCYSYDLLHRLTAVTHPTGPNSTPAKQFVYDAATVNGSSMSNAKGKMAEAYTCTGSCTSKITDLGFSYSVRGEATDLYESTPHSGAYYHITNAYWANGAVKSLSGIPGITTITHTPDGEGRWQSVADTSQTLATATQYSAWGSATSVTFGSLDSDSFTYDPNTGRMSSYAFNVNSHANSGTLTWNANGSLSKLAITDALNAADTQICNYLYDDLQRLVSGVCGALWGQTFTYDAFGNATKSVPNGSSGISFQPTYNTSTNQFLTVPGVTPSYDGNGNLTHDDAHTYSWDAEGHPLTLDSVSVTYDAMGRPVETATGSAYAQLIYGPNGEKIAMASGQTLAKAFVRLPGGAKAVYNSGGLAFYRHSDWLGSSRVASTPARTVYGTGAYAPFGETYAQSGTSDLSYTDQNQDTISGLYDFPARRYSPVQGRWISPDPSGTNAVVAGNPQSWNRYVYVLGDPLRMVDPTGLDACEDDPMGPRCPQPLLGTGPSDDWWDMTFGAQNKSIDFSRYDNSMLMSSLGSHYWNLPGRSDPVAEGLAIYDAQVQAGLASLVSSSSEKKSCATRLAAGVQQNTGTTPTNLQYTGTVGGHANYTFDVSDPTGFQKILNQNPAWPLPFGLDQGSRYGVIQSTHIENTVTGGFTGHTDLFNGHSFLAPLHWLVDVGVGHIPGVNLDFGCKAGS